MNLQPTEQDTTQPMRSQAYTSRFYSGTAPGSLASARLLLGLLFESFRPKSVIDVGCGNGAWLAAAEELGANKLVGIDGSWGNPAALLSRNISFRPVDLESAFEVGEMFDLCISVEVAEHLSPDAAQRFVRSLCSASDVVLFSAAIRHQGGVLHINEQRQSYWANLFESAGYECHDVFRPVFWPDPRVDTWYRQNAFLYIKGSHPCAAKMRERALLRGPLDIVHPELFEGNLENYQRAIEAPTLRFCWQCLGRWSKRQLKKALRIERNGS
jgi:SAM-dependent methyltransferase